MFLVYHVLSLIERYLFFNVIIMLSSVINYNLFFVL